MYYIWHLKVLAVQILLREQAMHFNSVKIGLKKPKDGIKKPRHLQNLYEANYSKNNCVQRSTDYLEGVCSEAHLVSHTRTESKWNVITFFRTELTNKFQLAGGTHPHIHIQVRCKLERSLTPWEIFQQEMRTKLDPVNAPLTAALKGLTMRWNRIPCRR